MQKSKYNKVDMTAMLLIQPKQFNGLTPVWKKSLIHNNFSHIFRAKKCFYLHGDGFF